MLNADFVAIYRSCPICKEKLTQFHVNNLEDSQIEVLFACENCRHIRFFKLSQGISQDEEKILYQVTELELKKKFLGMLKTHNKIFEGNLK